jgi:hypothetical protein
MAKKVVLDAMIKRADFAEQAEAASIELADKMPISQLTGKSPMLRLLRKPDFQRETNHWSPEQVASFISSFARGELIPSLILWKSSSHVFVIDGGHRLSALRAWMENDYGDGTISHGFFNGEIPANQKMVGKQTRALVENRVGRYDDFLKLSEEEQSAESEKATLASTIFTRAIHVQWIQGSQEVAEVSFFKINSQGTPLDPVEELLLKNRRKSYAIAARSIIRAGTGHKYWSNFDTTSQKEIEDLSAELFELLFQPHLEEPIKTLDLPLGGTVSPVDALKMLLDMFALVAGQSEPEKAVKDLTNDLDGSKTIEALKSTRKVARRMTGTSAPSLGLHPAVYFYNEKGKHSRFLFLGLVKLFSDAVRNNNSLFFHKFTKVRKTLEQTLVIRKSLINQGLANVNSRQRIDRVSRLLAGLIADLETTTDVSDTRILELLGLTGSVGALKIIDVPTGFSDDVKTAVYLRQSLKSALRCPICEGYLDPSKAVSYDHVNPIRDGGLGTEDNLQLAHPFCNSGVKS